jgi:hypothetical protein
MRRLQVDRRDLTRRARLRRQLSIDLDESVHVDAHAAAVRANAAKVTRQAARFLARSEASGVGIRLTSLTQPLAPPRSASGCSRLGRTPAGRTQSVIPRPTTIEVPVSTVEAAPRRLSAA